MRRSVKWLLERGGAALFLDPGLSKTAISYAALKMLKKEGLLDGALVVGPRRPIVETWPDEAKSWFDFHDLKVALIHGPKKEELLEERADVYLVTYDGLQWLIEKGHLAKLLRKRWLNVLIMDELSKLKHPRSSRHRALKKWLHRFERRWGLTGSAASNGLMDLFGQVYCLDLGHALGAYITHFRLQYFNPVYPEFVMNLDPKDRKKAFATWIPKLGAEQAIYDRLKHIALRIDGEEHLQLPQLISVPMRFDLPPKLRQYYEELEAKMWFEIPEGEIFTAKSAATVSQKCRQLTSGAMYEDLIDPITGEPRVGKRKFSELHDIKIEMVLDLIDELQGQQLFVAYEFRHEAARLERALKGLDFAIIGGGTSDKDAREYMRRWNNKELQILLGHPNSVGHGLNLQRGSAEHICWFSGTWDFELYDQFNRRLKRQGSQASHIILHTLIARDTVDEAVFYAMGRKRRVQDDLYAALRKR